MHIIDATKAHAPLIAKAIMVAIGDDICKSLAGENNTVEDVEAIFTRLAMQDETLYSYRNTRIVVDDNDVPAGFCISYDGANLIPWRRSFFADAIRTLGWQMTDQEIDDYPVETDGEEFYIDTLMVLPESRRKGIGAMLITDAILKSQASGKPIGLLCDMDNHTAKALYNKMGFAEVGKRPFAGVTMHHLQYKNIY